MRGGRGRTVVVESVDELRRRLDAGAHRVASWRIVGLDLRAEPTVLASLEDADVSGAAFVGCPLPADVADRLAARGAVLLHDEDVVPVDPRRAELYTPDELYDTRPYAGTLDARAFAWAQTAHDPDATLARALHDHGVDEALGRWRAGRSLVGVMGGHAGGRGSDGYRDAARLGRLLAAHRTVVTGGGPGAMEAANLGARHAGEPEERLDESVRSLAAVPSFRPSVDAWLDAAWAVRESLGGSGAGRAGSEDDRTVTLGVPTWFYGHEPPNVFATAVAKLFGNPLREARLLEICDAGIVVLPGAAGTVQEIFADACENYYGDESSVAPMVLVGVQHWTERTPAWPLLRALARGRAMEPHVHLVETVDEAAAVIG